MARNLENKRITRVMSLQRVGKVGGSSRSDTDGNDPSPILPDCERQKKKSKRMIRVMSLQRIRTRLL